MSNGIIPDIIPDIKKPIENPYDEVPWNDDDDDYEDM